MRKMSSLQLPKDIEILKFLQEPRIRNKIKDHLKNHYASTLIRLNRLEKLGYVFVSRTEPWRKGKVMKYYLITPKGRAMLRGYEEAERREE